MTLATHHDIPTINQAVHSTHRIVLAYPLFPNPATTPFLFNTSHHIVAVTTSTILTIALSLFTDLPNVTVAVITHATLFMITAVFHHHSAPTACIGLLLITIVVTILFDTLTTTQHAQSCFIYQFTLSSHLLSTKHNYQ